MRAYFVDIDTGVIMLEIVPRTHIDDEYANAMERDPKILLTTSRNPSAPLTQFVKVGVVILIDLWIVVCILLIDYDES